MLCVGNLFCVFAQLDVQSCVDVQRVSSAGTFHTFEFASSADVIFQVLRVWFLCFI